MPKGIMLFTSRLCVCVCVCLCVCHQDCDEMAAHSSTVLREAISLDNSSILQQYQDDPPADPDHMDHLYKMTFWPITSKLMNGFTPHFICI